MPAKMDAESGRVRREGGGGMRLLRGGRGWGSGGGRAELDGEAHVLLRVLEREVGRVVAREHLGALEAEQRRGAHAELQHLEQL